MEKGYELQASIYRALAASSRQGSAGRTDIVYFTMRDEVCLTDSASQSANLFGAGTRCNAKPPQDMDWVPQRGASLEIQDPGNLVAQEGRMELVDTRATNPIGVEVLQESFVDTAAENEDIVIVQYTIANPTGTELTNIHVGQMFNWRMNSTWGQDHVGFDGSRNLGLQQDAASNPTVVVGTMPLSANAAVHFRALRSGESRTDQSKWSYLTGGIKTPGSGADFWAQVTGLGPFTIAPGQEVQVAFAVVTGRSRADLFQNADNAKALWESTLQQAPTAQFIQNVDGSPLDVYVDGQRVFDDWTFQSASAFDVLSQGEHTIDVVRGGGMATMPSRCAHNR